MFLPLLTAQREIWFAEQRLNPVNRIYKLGEYVEIYGSVDTVLFETALRRVVGETDSLNVRFVEGNDGPQQVFEPLVNWLMPVVDVSNETDPHTSAQAWMTTDMARPMDLTEGPLFSYALIKMRADLFLWYQSYHHIVMDGISLSLVARRVAHVYTALPNSTKSPARHHRLNETSHLRIIGSSHPSRSRAWIDPTGSAPPVPHPISIDQLALSGIGPCA